MRLSTASDRDDDRAVAVLHAAFDTGVDFLDTADAYCLDEGEAGHNERLIARAIASWSADRSTLRVATKGGLTRPGGAWVPDGRARHLEAACAASRRALGVERLSLYQLHAPDPRTPLERSVRALAGLKRGGLVEAIGLSNVTLGQIEEARRIVEVAAVQVELSPWNDDSVMNGVAGYCLENGIRLLAYRPFGGADHQKRLLTDPLLAQMGARHGATSHEVVLAWLRSLSPLVVPLPGPTRVETARSVGRAAAIALSDEERALLAERFPAGRILRPPRRHRRPAEQAEGEVVLVMGLPGAGKSSLALELVRQGYERLNRDETGGRLADLLPALDRLVASGRKRVVLDNTYTSRKSRGAVVERAFSHGLPVRCVWLDAGLEEAQVNAALRMVVRYGRLLEPGEMRKAVRTDPGAFAPSAQFRHRRDLEPPSLDEGFSRVDVVPFRRRPDPARTGRAVFVWCDDVLWQSRSGRRVPSSGEDALILPGRREVLLRHHEEGFVIVGLSWQPEIDEGTTSARDLDAGLARMKELLGVPIDILYCPHGGGPLHCWCRKPLPGLGVVAILHHALDPSRCLCVGQGTTDSAFARRLGFEFHEAAEFFGTAARSKDGSG
jgi:aryl-alcohol dehydrogenase-like predicted oxidoreductase/histidinol phosphatase-like enzyme